MNSTVPEGWKIQKLDGKVEILSGFPFKSSLFCDDPSRMGIIRIRDLVKQSIETFYEGEFDESFVVRKGDILIGMDGDFNIVKWKARNALLNQRICKVKASLKSVFNSDFLFYSLIDDLNAIHSATGATTVKHLSVKDIRAIEKAYPPLLEQQKIATILSSVDNVIETTRAQIDKLKDLKTGMMQELLTKGIAHTEFKPVPKWRVGRISEMDVIPTAWELVEMLSVAKLESGHTPSREKDEYWGGGMQWLSLHDTKNLSNPVIEKTVYSVTQKGIDNSSARILPKNTVALSRTASVGNCVMLGRDMATSQDFANYVCGDKLNPKYLLHLFRWMQHVWSNLSEGSTHKTIYMPVFKKLKILLPPLPEQKKIADTADKLDFAINAQRQKLCAAVNLKKALMQDLLTGKVRVKIDEKEKESAVA